MLRSSLLTRLVWGYGATGSGLRGFGGKMGSQDPPISRPRQLQAPTGNHFTARQYVSIRDLMLGIDHTEAEEAQFNKDFPQCRLVKGRYLSPWSRQTEKGFKDAMEWLWTRRQNKLKLSSLKGLTLEGLLQPQMVDMECLKELSNQSTISPHVTWIGHATCYFEVEGVKFITDPVFSDRASPSQLIGPERFFEPGVRAKDLDIDVVLLSHTHYDHLDYYSARDIGNKPLWLVPLGVKDFLENELGITNCIEMNWWDSHNIPSNIAANPSLAQAEGITITFTPAKHWTARGLFDRNTCLWGSFAVNSSTANVFFGGDSAYCDVFKQIATRLGPFDLSLIPIGAYKPRYFMKDHHCDPTEAVQIHKDLQSTRSLAIHWGTFPLADEDVLEPALELGRARHEAGLSGAEFFTMRAGDTYIMHDLVPSTDTDAAVTSVADEVAVELQAPPGDIESLHPTILNEYVNWKENMTQKKKRKGRRIKDALETLSTNVQARQARKNSPLSSVNSESR